VLDHEEIEWQLEAVDLELVTIGLRSILLVPEWPSSADGRVS
jgi:hypothetical protein